MAIRSFADARTEALFRGGRPGHWGNIAGAARRKLDMLDAAETLADLRSPPGNRLERLAGDRAGHYSSRVNDQWRICFRWTASGPEDVETVDYH